MEYRKGDLLVFTGNFDNSDHYRNFEKGKGYVIERIETVGYSLDETTGHEERCILFKGHRWGALEKNAGLYFRSISEQRERILDDITGD